MSALLLSRIDTERLYPPFLRSLQAMLDDALSHGESFWVVSGWRSYEEQNKLFAQGRSKPGKIVTRARGGQSAHNFGIAVDLVRDGLIDRAGIQPDYKPESYELLRMLAPKHGLVWGGAWKFRDCPHVQIPHYLTAGSLEPLDFCYQRGGLTTVFPYLDLEPRNDARPQP